MLRLTELRLPLDHDESAIRTEILRYLAIPARDLVGYSIFRRGVDARKPRAIVFIYTLDIEVADEQRILAKHRNDQHLKPTPDMSYRFVARAPETPLASRPVIVGMGPAGLFAGLILAQSGFRPIILERGKEVRERTKDTFGLWRTGVLNPESNVQFGEGGAGTFSDGKLHTQIKDRKHYGRKVLEELVAAGAPPEILYVSKPHIGTYRLVAVVEILRAKILELGGEIRFQSRMDDIDVVDGQIRGAVLASGEHIPTAHLIAAIGHSARDTFEMLCRRGVHIDPKPFSVGFRIEHPQSLIDRGRYGKNAGNPLLGAADYKLVHHAKNGRSVYSFCMCPGGTVVAASNHPERVVVNGMSYSGRRAAFANSAVVVEVTPADYPGRDPLAGARFQDAIEARAWDRGGGGFKAPGQLVVDLLAGRASTDLPRVTYTLGVTPGDLREVLPEPLVEGMIAALRHFDRQLPGFAGAEAVLIAPETRTTAPLRFLRGADFQSPGLPGLIPLGEGAGYAGGIASAALDGFRAAQMWIERTCPARA